VRGDPGAVNRWLAATLVALGVTLLALPLAFERVVGRPAEVRFRFLDRYTGTVYRDSFPDADLMNGLVLAAGAGLAVMTALLVARRLVGTPDLKWFFIVSGVGLGALAVEETFELSETAALLVGVDPKRTDVFVPLLGLVFLVAFRRVLLSSRRALWIGASGAALFVAALFSDSLAGKRNFEDPLESVASLVLLTAFVVLALELVSGRPREAVA
jgi:hypothetical protein